MAMILRSHCKSPGVKCGDIVYLDRKCLPPVICVAPGYGADPWLALEDGEVGDTVQIWPIFCFAIDHVVSRPYPELARHVLEVRDGKIPCLQTDLAYRHTNNGPYVYDWDYDAENEAIYAWLQSRGHLSAEIDEGDRKFEL